MKYTHIFNSYFPDNLCILVIIIYMIFPSPSHPTLFFWSGYSNPYVVSTINFLTVTGNDTGVYRCTASNSNGSVYINVNLLLYGKVGGSQAGIIEVGSCHVRYHRLGTPTAPTNVNVVTYNGSVLNVTWGPPASNGNLDIISYTVRYSGRGRGGGGRK